MHLKSRRFLLCLGSIWPRPSLASCLLGGLAITSLSALGLPTAKEASMERFIRNALIVGPSVVTIWSWLAARGQRQLEGSATAVTQESIELRGSTDATSQ